MKKILYILLILVPAISFCFEGTIEQKIFNQKENEFQTFKWHIKNQNIKLDIIKADGNSYSIIPNKENKGIYVLMNTPSEDGNFWYFDVPLNELDETENVLKIEEKSTDDNKATNECKLLTDNGLLTFSYSSNIDFNTITLAKYFRDNLVFSALMQLDVSFGFPIEAVLLESKSGNSTNLLKTLSIQEKSISSGAFTIPSNYRLFEGVK